MIMKTQENFRIYLCSFVFCKQEHISFKEPKRAIPSTLTYNHFAALISYSRVNDAAEQEQKIILSKLNSVDSKNTRNLKSNLLILRIPRKKVKRREKNLNLHSINKHKLPPFLQFHALFIGASQSR